RTSRPAPRTTGATRRSRRSTPRPPRTRSRGPRSTRGMSMSDVTRADVCALACADLFATDGEILVSPMGTMPLIGARVARLTFAPRGGPGNTINHRTSYWVPRHSARVFTESVDFVSGVGTDRAVGDSMRFHDLHRVVSNLGVFDFGGPARTMRVVSVHPGVTVDEVQAATAFPLHVDGSVATTRLPSDAELEV